LTCVWCVCMCRAVDVWCVCACVQAHGLILLGLANTLDLPERLQSKRLENVGRPATSH
jgi:hypothetical protein